MSALTFEDATPVKVSGSGRTAAPNPYTAIIAEIAGKKNGNGEPVAKRFTVEHTPEESKTVLNRVKRQFSDAGAANNPPVTVRVHIVPAQDAVGKESSKKSVVTFWTVKRQERPRTPAPTIEY